MTRRRRLVEAEAAIASLVAENQRLAGERHDAFRLAQRRYDLLQAVYRENETLRSRLGDSQRSALGDTVPMPRIRSLPPQADAAPATPGPMCIADGELWMQPIRRRE